MSHFDHRPRQRLTSDRGSLSISQSIGVKPESINPMLRRRLPPLGQVAIWCAEQVIETSRYDGACVFASRHGEVARTTDILKTLTNTAEVSPAAFSMSVHNAIGGIFTIANEIYGNVTAVAAGDNTLFMALLESAALLEEEDINQVLCVVYDQPIPEILQHDVTGGSDISYAIALLIDSNITHRFTFESSGNQKTGSQTNSSAFLPFVRYMLDQEELSLQLNLEDRCWEIEKLVVQSDG